jgi:circadian clock protein KaiB
MGFLKNKNKMNGKSLFRFSLFISGDGLISKKAIFNCKKSLDFFLQSNYEINIIDVFENPKLAIEENIIALPILIRKNPLPELRIIGDMSNLELFKTELLLI